MVLVFWGLRVSIGLRFGRFGFQLGLKVGSGLN